jgi:hypothetical protein
MTAHVDGAVVLVDADADLEAITDTIAPGWAPMRWMDPNADDVYWTRPGRQVQVLHNEEAGGDKVMSPRLIRSDEITLGESAKIGRTEIHVGQYTLSVDQAVDLATSLLGLVAAVEAAGGRP